MFTIVHMEQVMPITRPLALQISFYNGYESVAKGISDHEQVLVI